LVDRQRIDYFKYRIRTKHFFFRLFFNPADFTVAFVATLSYFSPQMSVELFSSDASRKRIRRDRSFSSLCVAPPTHDRILTNVIQVRSVKPVSIREPREEDFKASVYAPQLRVTNCLHRISLPAGF
jgi:hypothetical protein